MPKHPKDSPPILFVFLGASNLARGHSALANCLQRNLYPRSTRFLYALGPGRSYCSWSGFMGMVYPPIRNSQIFLAARENAKCQLVAVVTDIGNDIMYNVKPEDITDCLGKIFQQFQEFNALILTSPIPSGLETELSRFSFFCLRNIFYPKSNVSYEQTVSGIRQINKFLKDSVSENIHLINGLEGFFGLDKIHFSLRKGHFAWSKVATQIMQALNFDISARIGHLEMLASYGTNIKQLLAADLFSMQSKGPEYF